VAKEAGLPSLLVENFTWNWMYDGLGPRFDKHKDYLGRIYEQAAYHIQTEPICQHQQGNLTVGPISRSPRHDREYTRKKLGVSDTAHLILVAMGGIEDRYDPLTSISIPPGCSIIFPGASSKVEKHGNLILLPHASEFFHPDLIHACDAVIGKAGYSTIAEIFAAGIPYGYILRKDSRESAILQQFIRRHISGFEIEESDFRSGNWVDYLDNLLALPAVKHPIPNSADRVARNVLNVIDGGKQ
jgi:hypothetical protein